MPSRETQEKTLKDLIGIANNNALQIAIGRAVLGERFSGQALLEWVADSWDDARRVLENHRAEVLEVFSNQGSLEELAAKLAPEIKASADETRGQSPDVNMLH